MDLLQIACGTQIYLIEMWRLKDYPIPRSLLAYLQNPSIRKIGGQVGGDISRIEKMFNVQVVTQQNGESRDCGKTELGQFCRSKGIIPSGRSSLADICAAVLGRRLPKPESVRLGQWDCVLSQEQKT